MHLITVVLWADILVAICGIHGFNSSNSSQNGDPVQWMTQWMLQHNDMVYMKCENGFEDSGNVLMRQFPWKYTRWSHLRDMFIKIYRPNMYLNMRTVLVIATTARGKKACISLVSAARRWFLLDAVILVHDNRQLGQIQGLVAHRGKGSIGTAASFLPKTEAHETRTSKPESSKRFPRRCLSFESGSPGKWKSSLEGCEILFACYPSRHYKKAKETTCEDKAFKILHDVLRAVNATPRFQFYADYDSMTVDLPNGRVDISLGMSLLTRYSYRRYAFPRVLEYSHEKFYTWNGEQEKSFVTTVIHSKAVIGFLLVIFVVSWLTLCFGEFLQYGWHLDCSLVMNFATFLLATFLATSFPLRLKRVAPNFRWRTKSQATVIFIWVLGIFPLSFYLRGELTSRLTITIAPNPIDTIDELERALDTGQLTPCIVRKGALSYLFTNENEAVANLNNIDRKLKLALQKNGPPLTYSHHSDCLRFCAMRAGYACIKYSSDDCPQHTYTRRYAVSRESLRLMLGFVPVRKDFERAKAYENILGRIFETGLDIYSSQSHSYCGQQLMKGNIGSKRINQDDEAQASQVFRLSVFFATFCAVLSFAAIVFCLEVFLGWKRHNN